MNDTLIESNFYGKNKQRTVEKININLDSEFRNYLK